MESIFDKFKFKGLSIDFWILGLASLLLVLVVAFNTVTLGLDLFYAFFGYILLYSIPLLILVYFFVSKKNDLKLLRGANLVWLVIILL